MALPPSRLGLAAGCGSSGEGSTSLARPTQRLRQLLEFTTALKVLPPREHPKSLMNQPVVLKRVKQGVHLLPTAGTCARELYLPAYADLDTLRARFECALDHMEGSGFGYQ